MFLLNHFFQILRDFDAKCQFIFANANVISLLPNWGLKINFQTDYNYFLQLKLIIIKTARQKTKYFFKIHEFIVVNFWSVFLFLINKKSCLYCKTGFKNFRLKSKCPNCERPLVVYLTLFCKTLKEKRKLCFPMCFP